MSAVGETINILFCDNEATKHQTFKEAVLLPLRRDLPSTYDLKVWYSQSLDPIFEAGYQNECKKDGARSVRAFLDDGLRFDLVITDMDFDQVMPMGSTETGIDIIEEVSKRTRDDCPWLQFMFVTAFSHLAQDRRLMRLAPYLGNEDESFIELSQDDARSWEKVRGRAQLLIGRIVQERSRLKDWMSRLAAPELYEVIIFRKELAENPMRVVVREREEGGNVFGFRLGAQSVTFAALAESPKGFITEGHLVRAASKRKAAAVGETLVRLDLQQQERLLSSAKIQWLNNTEFCNLRDSKDMCAVSNGKRVTAGSIGYQCQDKLGSVCVKKLYSQEVSAREMRVSADSVRRHLSEIRAMVSESGIELRTRRVEMDAAGGRHWGEHAAGTFCGNCLVYRRRDKPGYALAASVKWQDFEEEEDLVDAFEATLAGKEPKENEDAF